MPGVDGIKEHEGPCQTTQRKPVQGRTLSGLLGDLHSVLKQSRSLIDASIAAARSARDKLRACRRGASIAMRYRLSAGKLRSRGGRNTSSIAPMVAPAASIAASLGTSAGRGSSMCVGSAEVNLAACAALANRAANTRIQMCHVWIQAAPAAPLLRRAAGTRCPALHRQTHSSCLPIATLPMLGTRREYR